MSEPVLVVHGVAIRREDQFRQQIADLNRKIGERWNLIPVYWGDLGARPESIAHTLPADVRKALEQDEGMDDAMDEEEAEQAARPPKSRWRGLGEKIDRFKSRYSTRFTQSVRRSLTANLIPFIGDVLIYGNPSGRRRIEQRIEDALAEHAAGYGTAEKPISMIGHSLGGVIAFDLAVRAENPIHLRRFITLGSQPAFFHVMDPRSSLLEPFAEDRPTTLPPTIGDWVNVWEGIDVLAFGTEKVFRLHDGRSPRDVFFRNKRALNMIRAHNDYFICDEVAEIVGRSL